MKLGYWTPPNIFHSVYKEKTGYKYYRTDCHASEDIHGNNEDYMYPTFQRVIPTKNNICNICFQENKKEIVFLLTKIKLGI